MLHASQSNLQFKRVSNGLGVHSHTKAQQAMQKSLEKGSTSQNEP